DLPGGEPPLKQERPDQRPWLPALAHERPQHPCDLAAPQSPQIPTDLHATDPLERRPTGAEHDAGSEKGREMEVMAGPSMPDRQTHYQPVGNPGGKAPARSRTDLALQVR